MNEVAEGVHVCPVCKTTKCTTHASPVLMSRAGIGGLMESLKGILYIGGFTLLLLATMLFSAYPRLEAPVTWLAILALYGAYFGLAMANFRRKLFV